MLKIPLLCYVMLSLCFIMLSSPYCAETYAGIFNQVHVHTFSHMRYVANKWKPLQLIKGS